MEAVSLRQEPMMTAYGLRLQQTIGRSRFFKPMVSSTVAEPLSTSSMSHSSYYYHSASSATSQGTGEGNKWQETPPWFHAESLFSEERKKKEKEKEKKQEQDKEQAHTCYEQLRAGWWQWAKLLGVTG
jgi:hypothetical protein